MIFLKLLKSNFNLVKIFSHHVKPTLQARTNIIKLKSSTFGTLCFSLGFLLASPTLISRFMSKNFLLAKESSDNNEDDDLKDMDYKIHLDLNEIYEKCAVMFLSNKEVNRF